LNISLFKQANFERQLIDSFGVHVNAGSMYGGAGEGFIRINTACPETTLREALHRIASGLKFFCLK